MLVQIADLLLLNVFGLLVYMLLLRFYMQLLRAPFRNPAGQFVTALTNWMVFPARRLIPGLMGIDFATILLAWLVQALMLTLLLLLHGKTLASASGAGAGLVQPSDADWAAARLVDASVLRRLPAFHSADRQRGPVPYLRSDRRAGAPVFDRRRGGQVLSTWAKRIKPRRRPARRPGYSAPGQAARSR